MTIDPDPDLLFMFACALLLAVAAYAIGYVAGWRQGNGTSDQG